MNREMWTSLPCVITEYDGKLATVRPLVMVKYKDSSVSELPKIPNVQVITPHTAYAGMKLPVRVGDKGELRLQDRDIQTLLFDHTTAGLEDPGTSIPQTRRKHALTDAIMYVGFDSIDSIKETDEDLWIFNNDDDLSRYNFIRFRKDGTIETRNQSTTVRQNPDGSIEVLGDSKVTVTAPEVEVNGTTTINGNTSINGTLSVSSNISSGDNITAAGNITAGGTIKAPNIVET